MFVIVESFAQRWPRAARRFRIASMVAGLVGPSAAWVPAVLGHGMLAVFVAVAGAWLFHAGYQATIVHRDSLTGLPTRDATERILRRAARRRAGLTVAIGDIDGLHALNGRLGHAAGDQYLITVADRLRRAVPKRGMLARHGGDEFVILAPNVNPAELADAIGAAMSGPARIGGYQIQPRVSVGIATSDAGDAILAMARADAAMYSAKAAGSNHVRVYFAERDAAPVPHAARPFLRRRDLNPGANNLDWAPTAADELAPLPLTRQDGATIYHALCIAAGSDSGPNLADAASGVTSNAQRGQHVYRQLAAQLRPLIDVADEPTIARASAPSETTVAPLIGISADFTPDEIEALVRTAAEAVHGDADGLSTRQRDLAARAHHLLSADTDDASR